MPRGVALHSVSEAVLTGGEPRLLLDRIALRGNSREVSGGNLTIAPSSTPLKTIAVQLVTSTGWAASSFSAGSATRARNLSPASWSRQRFLSAPPLGALPVIANGGRLPGSRQGHRRNISRCGHHPGEQCAPIRACRTEVRNAPRNAEICALTRYFEGIKNSGVDIRIALGEDWCSARAAPSSRNLPGNLHSPRSTRGTVRLKTADVQCHGCFRRLPTPRTCGTPPKPSRCRLTSGAELAA